jgi:hypothetical protein
LDRDAKHSFLTKIPAKDALMIWTHAMVVCIGRYQGVSPNASNFRYSAGAVVVGGLLLFSYAPNARSPHDETDLT